MLSVARLMMILVSVGMLLFFGRMTYADKEARGEHVSVNFSQPSHHDLASKNNNRQVSFSHSEPAANSFHSQATFSHTGQSINTQRNAGSFHASDSGWRNKNNRHTYIYVAPYYIPYYYGYYPSYSNETNYSSEPASNEDYNTNQNVDTNQVWVAASNGEIPNNAVVYSDENGSTTYYCRGIYNNVLYTGELVPNEACYAQDG